MPLAQGTYFIYTIKPNDTLYKISGKLGSTIEQIEQLNSLYPPFTDPGLIFPGQRLVVRYQYNPMTQVFYFINPGDNLSNIAYRFSSDVNGLIAINPQIENPNIIYPNQLIEVPVKIYIIATGDTLQNIANRFGISISSIIRANQGRAGFSPDVIYPGYGIILP